MRINEMEFTSMQPGLKFRGITNRDKIGKVIYVDYLEELSVYYAWEGEEGVGNWYHVDCECEVVLDENEEPVVDKSSVAKEYLKAHTKNEETLIKYYKDNVNKPGSKLFGLKLPSVKEEKLPALINAIGSSYELKEANFF